MISFYIIFGILFISIPWIIVQRSSRAIQDWSEKNQIQIIKKSISFTRGLFKLKSSPYELVYKVKLLKEGRELSGYFKFTPWDLFYSGWWKNAEIY